MPWTATSLGGARWSIGEHMCVHVCVYVGQCCAWLCVTPCCGCVCVGVCRCTVNYTPDRHVSVHTSAPTHAHADKRPSQHDELLAHTCTHDNTGMLGITLFVTRTRTHLHTQPMHLHGSCVWVLGAEFGDRCVTPPHQPAHIIYTHPHTLTHAHVHTYTHIYTHSPCTCTGRASGCSARGLGTAARTKRARETPLSGSSEYARMHRGAHTHAHAHVQSVAHVDVQVRHTAKHDVACSCS